jgi:hypothetical protein
MAGSLGYRGYARVTGTKYVLPLTGARLSEEISINESRSIHGGGVGTVDGRFASLHNYAVGQARYEGELNGEVFAGTGNYANAFSAVLTRAIGASPTDISARDAGFNTTEPIILSPGGGSEWVFPKSTGTNAKAVIGSMNLSARVGGNVEFSASVVSCGADFNSSATNAPAVTDFAYEPGGTTDDSNPLPYYASAFTVTGSGETGMTERITSWQISINNNPVPIFTFDGNNYASDVLLGLMEVSGSFEYYSPDGVFVRNLTHGASATITFGSRTITMPHLAFGPYPVPLPGPNDPTIRTVNFKCFASASYPSIYSI